jgi:peptidoglycan/LPS O-acetylase OafA/YrhL
MEEKRNSGLDAVRSMAIIMVLISHITILLPGPLSQRLWHLGILGYYGVELFFVLSGFLIGRILLEMFAASKTGYTQAALLSNFYLRRWYRTLPLYYLILACNTIYWAKMNFLGFPAVKHPDWRYLVFLQNYQFFKLPEITFFPESWSLAIEEWFYLFFPLFIIFLKKITQRNSVKYMGLYLGGFIAALLCARIWYVYQYNPLFDLGVRKNIFLRLDSLGIGIFTAYVAMYFPALHRKMAETKIQIPAYLGLVAVAVYFWLVGWTGWDNSLFARTFMLDIVSILFALTTTGAYYLCRKEIKFFTIVSKISYALYLVHLPTFATLGYFFAAYISTPITVLPAIMAAFLLSGSLSYGLYYRFERPIMRLRPKSLKL